MKNEHLKVHVFNTVRAFGHLAIVASESTYGDSNAKLYVSRDLNVRDFGQLSPVLITEDWREMEVTVKAIICALQHRHLIPNPEKLENDKQS